MPNKSDLDVRRAHLIEMETLMNEALIQEKKLDAAIQVMRDLPQLVMPLLDWMDSGEWLKDYDLDATGAFQDISRGSLSEDGLYDLITSLDERTKELEQLCQTYQKKTQAPE